MMNLMDRFNTWHDAPASLHYRMGIFVALLVVVALVPAVGMPLALVYVIVRLKNIWHTSG